MFTDSLVSTARTHLHILQPSDAHLLLDYHISNQAHLAPWVPETNAEAGTLEYWQGLLIEQHLHFKAGHAVRLAALNPEKTHIIGLCSFTNIVRGAFQACHLGYSVAQRYEGQGYMLEVLSAGIEYMFTKIDLHRIMANYIPSNTRSAAVLHRLGFQQEGKAKSYLKIAGQWQDHILTAKLNPRHS